MKAKVYSLQDITSALLDYTETFSFVIRDNKVSEEAKALLGALDDHLIESRKASEWPGTKLFWDQADLCTYNLNPKSAYILYSTESNLFDWLLPRLPEDLVFYKGSKPFFVSITHEREAYFNLQAGSKEFLESKGLI